MRILVVERNAAEGLASVLPAKYAEYKVHGVDSIELASSELATGAFDALMVDLTAFEDGFALLHKLKEERSRVVRFAMVSEASHVARTELSALSVVDWFVKPFDVEQVAMQLQAGWCESLCGELHNVSLPSFLQLLEIERKTCSVFVQAQGKCGELFVSRGELFDASIGEQRGEDAALRIIGWLSGSVLVEQGCPIVERAIERPVSYLLMTAMQMRDERGTESSFIEFDEENPPFKRLHDSLLPLRQSLPPSPRLPSFSMQLAPIPALPVGGLLMAVVDAQSGIVLTSHVVAQGTEITAWAESAAAVVRLEYSMLSVAMQQAEMHELVVTSASHCELIRPLVKQPHCFAMLVFDPKETNLVMARIDVERFIADYTR